jgi:hypothetical protein
MSYVQLSCQAVIGQRVCETVDSVLCPENRTAFENIPVEVKNCMSRGRDEERFSKALCYNPEGRGIASR